MMSTAFTTVAEAQRHARRNLPRSVYQAFSAVSGTGADNLRALQEVGFRPRVGARCPRIELGTTVLGQELTMPVIASPVGGLRLAHRRGGDGRGAGGRGRRHSRRREHIGPPPDRGHHR